ncbi:MAG: hypothetical protein IJX44_02290 [Bacteroidaceae bacterium]|nr:hypothetical protein [Bacteroidaceae bacterium]
MIYLTIYVAKSICKKWQIKWNLCGKTKESVGVQKLMPKVAKNVADFKIWAVNNLFIPNTLGVVKSGKLSGATCEIYVNSKHGSYVAEICF